MWERISIDELIQIDWDVSYSFTASELEQIYDKKSISKRLRFQSLDKIFYLDGICTGILQENGKGLLLAEGNNLSLKQQICAYQIQTKKELKYRLDFEYIIAKLSRHFISIASQAIDQGINLALQMIDKFEKVDRSYVFIFSDPSFKLMSNTYLTDVSYLDSEARTQQDFFEFQGIKSLICVPINHHESILGFVGFD